jgi:predicted dehydrogenase
MSKPLQIGLIGGGMWGRVHLDSVKELGGKRAETRWICTRTPENLEQLQKDYGVERGTTDYREILADPELDAVIVSTPPFIHAEQGIAVLEAGKHLLLEKPMATSSADAARLAEAAASRPELVSLDASCRFSRLNPKYAFVKEIIDAGRLGRVYLVHHHEMKPGTFLDHNPRASDWAADPDRAGGGPIIDWGPYDFSFHFGLMGDPTPPSHVSAVAHMEGGIERHAVATVEFGGGLAYQLERIGGMPYQEKSTTRIHGTAGTLVFGYQPWEPQEIELYTRGADGGLSYETLHCHYERAWHENTYLLEHFLDCVEGEAEPMMTFPLAKRNLEVSLEILEATRR